MLGGISCSLDADAQNALSLDSCRSLALKNNRQMGVAKVKREMARNMRKSARTKYLPQVNASGAYIYTSKQVEYTGEALSMSLYYNGNQVYEPGTYVVSIFADGHMIGSRSFTFEK